MKKQAIIFDLDGTLAPTMEVLKSFLMQRVKDLRGHCVTSQELMNAFHQNFDEFLHNLGIEDALVRQTIDRELRSLESKQAKSEFFDGIDQLIGSLHHSGADLYLWTLRYQASALSMLKHNDVHHYFIDFQCGDHDEPKPSPIGMREKLLYDYEKITMIGDTVTDMIAAKNLQAVAVGVTWAKTNTESMLKDHGAFFVADTIEELRNYLRV